MDVGKEFGIFFKIIWGELYENYLSNYELSGSSK
jgi:hypothetical protein